MGLAVETDHRCRITFAFPERKQAKHTWVFVEMGTNERRNTHKHTTCLYFLLPPYFSVGWLLLQWRQRDKFKIR